MATAAPAAPPRTSRSFAGLLEEYAAPQKKFPPSRDLDLLDDDVATLSYEQMLNTRARFRPDPALDPQPDVAATLPEQIPLIAREEPQALPHIFTQTQSATAARMSSSVTVRLTEAENDRLRARAAEAGLTVSAYLRSCAFEVENLRAQVKQALAQMKQAEERDAKAKGSWLRRLLARFKTRA